MSTPPDRLLGLDWGTSSLRAFLMRSGAVIDERHSDQGIQRLAGEGRAGFERAFEAIAGDWCRHDPALPVLACGMVGSAQGWLDVPYVDCPADTAALAGGIATLRSAGGLLVHVVPGVRWQATGAAPDVMRGEETRAFGALQHDPAWQRGALLVLPGTHSKWVTLRDGRIESLATYMTGELFAVLRTHSILGRLMTPAASAQAFDAAAFLRGVAMARRAGAAGDLLHDLFSVRTLGLMQQLAASSLADYLSGLLVGNEMVSALARAEPALPVVLGGEAVLCERYARALVALQRPCAATLPNTAPQGLWALAQARRLVAA